MKRLYYKITRKLSSFDISPIESGGFSKFFIFLIWGLNAILFLGEESCDVFKHNVQTSEHYSVCTITKKISKAELYTETTILIDTREFVIISSYDLKIPRYDVVIKPTVRGPPSVLYS